MQQTRPAPRASQSLWMSAAGHHVVALATLTIIVSAMFGSMTHYLIQQTYDFAWHVDAAQQIAATGIYSHPHPVYQWVVITVEALLPGADFAIAAGVTTVLLHLAFAAISYGLVYPALVRHFDPGRAATAAGLIALALLIVYPITLPRPDVGRYWGFIPMNTFHNPTILALEPLALLLFACVVGLLAGQGRRYIALTAGVLVLATLAKPHFTLALLPAVTLLALDRWRRGLPPRAVALGAGVIGPGVIVLAIQYALTFNAGGSREAHMVIAPLHFYLSAPSPLWVVPKLLLSIAFPLAVTVGWRRAALADVPMRLAWLLFLGGAGMAYLLAEANADGVIGSGNWLWGSNITLLILFFAALRFFVVQAGPHLATAPPGRWPRLVWIALALLLLHVISGMVWFSLYTGGWAIPWGAHW